MKKRRFISAQYLPLFLVLGLGSLHAQPAVTPAGAALGFNITTFAGSLPINGSFGPFGVAVTGNGSVLVNDTANSIRYVFPDVDGQTPGTALGTAASGSGTAGYATAGGVAYGSESGGVVVQFNNDGTVNHVLTGVGAAAFLGMAANSVNGHLISVGANGFYDIDPLANGGLGSSTLFFNNAGQHWDGVGVSTDGTIAYVGHRSNPVVEGYRISDGVQVFTSTNFPGTVDGVAVISSPNPALNGKLIVNTNDFGVYLLDPVANTIVQIATLGAGQRGDYVSPDPTNGTLFLDGTSLVARLSCASCRIGSAATFGQLDASYQVRYAANLTSGIDSVINIINTGGNGNVPANGPGFGAGNGGNICVNIYTLDPNEELLSCCSCLLTPNQVVNLKVQSGIMSNTLTGFPTPSATIKLVGSSGIGSTAAAQNVSNCANSAATVTATAGSANVVEGGFIAFGATAHTTTTGQFAVTETPFIPAVLSASELVSLTTRCSAILGNASGAGLCSGCAKGALASSKK